MRWQSRMIASGGVLLLPLVAVPTARAQSVSPRVATAEARTAIQRVVPLLKASADTWFEKRSCSSCHHQGLGTIAMAMLPEFPDGQADAVYRPLRQRFRRNGLSAREGRA